MKKTITFIGNGNMAFSIAKGLGESYHIEVVGRDMQKLEAFERNLGIGVDKFLLDGFDITNKTLVVCVKPANTDEVGSLLKGKARVVYSVLAGVSINKLKNSFCTPAVVRSMPNLAASVQKSMTTLCGEIGFRDEAIEIFNSIGATRWLGSEKEIDIATALAGSGPAYLSLIAEALMDGAVKQGLKRDDAISITRGLFEGFATLVQDIHPALLKDGVMSPGGTTAAGYGALEEKGVRGACIDAVEKAYKKAVELGSA